MPSFNDFRLHVYGVWLLARGNTQGLAYLDTSKCGMWRSFGGFVWTLPILLAYWLKSPDAGNALVDMDGATYTSAFASVFKEFIRFALPGLALLLTAPFLKLGQRLNTVVVACNWAHVLIVYMGWMFISLPLMIRSELPFLANTFLAFVVLTLFPLLLFLTCWRILRITVAGKVLQRLAVVAILSLPLFLLDFLQKQFEIALG